jgi:hypothetical protein
MEDAGNQNAIGDLTVKHDMPAVFHAPEAGAYIAAGAPQHGIGGEFLAAGTQAGKVTDGLVFSPSAKGV